MDMYQTSPVNMSCPIEIHPLLLLLLPPLLIQLLDLLLTQLLTPPLLLQTLPVMRVRRRIHVKERIHLPSTFVEIIVPVSGLLGVLEATCEAIEGAGGAIVSCLGGEGGSVVVCEGGVCVCVLLVEPRVVRIRVVATVDLGVVTLIARTWLA